MASRGRPITPAIKRTTSTASHQVDAAREHRLQLVEGLVRAGEGQVLTRGRRSTTFASYTPDPPLPHGMRPGFLFSDPGPGQAGFPWPMAPFARNPCRETALQAFLASSSTLRNTGSSFFSRFIRPPRSYMFVSFPP